MKRYNWSNFLAMKQYNRFRNLFFEALQRYNIGSYKSFTDETTWSPSILENVSITTAILKIGSFIPQNCFALAEETLHGGIGNGTNEYILYKNLISANYNKFPL